MKKTLTVNLGGTVYHIDDDAYRLLDDYLANLKHFFRKQEGAFFTQFPVFYVRFFHFLDIAS